MRHRTTFVSCTEQSLLPLPQSRKEVDEQRGAHLQMSNTLDLNIRPHGQFLHSNTGAALGT